MLPSRAWNKEFLAVVDCLGRGSEALTSLPQLVPRVSIVPKANSSLYTSRLWWNTMECFH